MIFSRIITILGSRFQRRPQRPARPCVIRDGEPCLACKEDMKLERKIQTSGLQDKRRILRTQMNANHDPFVLKFPLEISSNIFHLSMEEEDHDPYYDELKKLPMQFLLGSVCWGWRQLARSTPELWSSFSFTLTKPTRCLPLVLQVITDWLQLSGNLPLTLRVFNHLNKTKRLSRETCGPLIDALNRHSGRWHELFLSLPPTFFADFCGTSPPSSLHNLRIAEDLWDSFDHSSLAEPPHFRMKSRPSPVQLLVSRISLFSIDILWNNLRHLEVEHMGLNECIEAIQQVPLLEFCCLGVDCDYFAPPDIHSSSFPYKTNVRLMHLRTLWLSEFRPWTLIAFLDILELPSLEDYCHMRMGANIAVDSLLSLLNRSGSRLKHLSLYPQSDPPAADLKKLFNAVPYLQTLTAIFTHSRSSAIPDIISYLLQVLSSSPPTLEGGVPGFLPYLQSLNLAFDSYEESIWGCIPSIYSWPHRKKLSLNVDPCLVQGIEVEILAKILGLIDQGADIRILHNREDFLQQFEPNDLLVDGLPVHLLMA